MLSGRSGSERQCYAFAYSYISVFALNLFAIVVKKFMGFSGLWRVGMNGITLRGLATARAVHGNIQRRMRQPIFFDDYTLTGREMVEHGILKKKVGTRTNVDPSVADEYECRLCFIQNRFQRDGLNFLTMNVDQAVGFAHTNIDFGVEDYRQYHPTMIVEMPEGLVIDGKSVQSTVVLSLSEQVLQVLLFHRNGSVTHAAFTSSSIIEQELFAMTEDVKRIVGREESGHDIAVRIAIQALYAAVNEGFESRSRVDGSAEREAVRSASWKTDGGWVSPSFTWSILQRNLKTFDGREHESGVRGSSGERRYVMKRRGHWRRQRHGAGLSLVKVIWIKPYLSPWFVGSEPEDNVSNWVM